MPVTSKASKGIAAGPKLRRPLADEVRGKIQASALINRLEAHAAGKCDLSPTQVRAIEVLLRKILPDLQSSELTIRDPLADLSDAELAARLSATLQALPAELRSQVIADAAPLH